MQLIACPGCDAARAAAKRCIADPGPPRTGTVPGLQRTTRLRLALRCARDTKGDQVRSLVPQCRSPAFWPNEPNCDFGQTNPTIILAKRSQAPRETHQPTAVRNERRPGVPVTGLFFTGNRATRTCRAERAAILANEPNLKTLLERWVSPAQALDRGAALFGVEPALARAGGRFGRPARTRRHRGAANQVEQAFARVLAIALLGAMALRADHQHALAREASAGKPLEPRAHVVGKARRAAHVEAKLHRARKLVDVLPARARGADEVLLELVLADADGRGDANHRRACHANDDRRGRSGLHAQLALLRYPTHG